MKRFYSLALFLLCVSTDVFSKQQYDIGIFAYRPANELQEKWSHFEDYLEQEIENSDFKLHVLGLDALEEGIETNRFDFVFTNPRHYIQLRHKYPLSGALATLVRNTYEHPVSALGGVIFTKKANKNINFLQDLINVRIASPGSGYLGGYQTQLYELMLAGIDPQQLNIQFTGGPHDKVFDYLENNKADVGFVRTSVIEQMIQEEKLDFSNYKIINRQAALKDYPFKVSTRLYPEWPFVALSKAPTDIAEKVASAILNLDSVNPVSNKIGIAGFTIAADYKVVEQTMRSLKLPPFDVSLEVNLFDLIKQHLAIFLLSVTCLILLAFMLLVYFYKNRLLKKEIESRAKAQSELQAILNTEPACVCISSSAGVPQVINKAGLSLLQAESIEQIQRKKMSDLINVEYRQAFGKIHNDALNGKHSQLEFKLVGLKGEEKWVSSSAVPYTDPATGEKQVLSVTQDISLQKENEARLQLTYRVFNSVREGIAITDVDSVIVEVNPAFSAITGYEAREAIGRKISLLSSGKHSKQFYDEMWGKIESNGFWQGEIWNKRKSGEIYAELLSVTSLKDSNGKTQFYIGIFSDISQVKDQQKQLDLLAYYDPLTRLPNRTLLSKKFDEAVARAEKTHSLLGVIFIDLDNFKPVNDQYGHEVGDALLISVSNSIQSCIREGDTLSRLGGDEFVLLLNDLQTTKQAEYTCERILDRLKAEREVLGYTLSVTASLGMTFYPKDDSDIDTLLRHADQAMYLAKQEGKHRYKIYDLKTQNELVSLNRRLNDINQALDKQQLKLFYQPKINLVTGEVFGAEALLRWIHPVKGIIPPLSFLPIIQGTELEIAVGNWVIDQALSQLSAWNLQGNRLEVSVNISSNHLLHPDFINNLSNTLAAYSDVEAKQLQLEILESERIRDINEMRQVIRVCQNDLGLSVALDDFGTGYSSLTHARSLSADLIKIDQSFVRDMLDDPDDFVIVDSVVKLAGSFKQSVIAEGIETIEHGLLLISMGCVQGQGYGISRPIPAEEFSDWLNHYQPFSEWIEFADKQYSNKQIRLLRLKLTVRRWHTQFIDYINSDDADNVLCPILDKDKCHCGIWLTSEANDLVFDDKTLSEIDEHHEDFHQVADDMLRLFIQGEVGQARDNIVLFEKRYQAFEQLINTLGQE